MIDYEQLGQFYLGRSFDMHAGQITQDLVLYDSKDLTTHAVIVGMTGSGKTGLGVTLLEEAAIDQIPSIVIDPKGDMGNLMLSFPGLEPADFRGWINPDEAARKGVSVDELAAEKSDSWKRGLAEWDQEPSRISRLRESADVAIYTPGSDAGLQLTVLKSLNAPPPAVRESSDALRERVLGTVSGLCALLGIDPDPIRSREHILLSSILDEAWRAGKSLDMASLIHAIRSPPFTKIGIMEVDQIFPPDARMQLAMTLNNVLASPGFAGWMQGEPLDIARLLYTPAGKPRISVLSIAHLPEHERMFFVTILLEEIISWMRSQAGTSSLRALLYMDEVFGYLPPTANPPSKTPLLTLLKQARAFGLGLVLATQNPVDLDYKALSNAGTWFLGRLQTERDKMRVLDGLEGASASAGMNFDRSRVEQILSGVGARVFLLNNVHEDVPVVFHTRWALSYLSGPMTRQQISELMRVRKQEALNATTSPDGRPSGLTAGSQRSTDPSANEHSALQPHPPILSQRIEQCFIPVAREIDRDARIRYEPVLLGRGEIHFEDTKSDVSISRLLFRLVPTVGRMSADPWDEADSFDSDAPEIHHEPVQNAGFIELPSELSDAKNFTRWKSALEEHVYRNERITLYYCERLTEYSRPQETEGEFRIRLRQEAREQRDVEMEKLRKKFASRLEKQEEAILRAEHRLATEEQQAAAAKKSAWISTGTSLLGALLGRKWASVTSASRAGTAMRAHTRASQQAADIEHASQKLERESEEKRQLEDELKTELERIHAGFEVESLEVTPYVVKPRKSDIKINSVCLLWRPFLEETDQPAWHQALAGR